MLDTEEYAAIILEFSFSQPLPTIFFMMLSVLVFNISSTRISSYVYVYVYVYAKLIKFMSLKQVFSSSDYCQCHAYQAHESQATGSFNSTVGCC